jgi:hypothetical protein
MVFVWLDDVIKPALFLSTVRMGAAACYGTTAGLIASLGLVRVRQQPLASLCDRIFISVKRIDISIFSARLSN